VDAGADAHLAGETAAAADIFQQIVATPAPAVPPGLDPTWWRTFTTEFTASMVTSTRRAPWAA
jgi:hypothetical protein